VRGIGRDYQDEAERRGDVDREADRQKIHDTYVLVNPDGSPADAEDVL